MQSECDEGRSKTQSQRTALSTTQTIFRSSCTGTPHIVHSKFFHSPNLLHFPQQILKGTTEEEFQIDFQDHRYRYCLSYLSRWRRLNSQAMSPLTLSLLERYLEFFLRISSNKITSFRTLCSSLLVKDPRFRRSLQTPT